MTEINLLREPPVAGDEVDTLLGSLERQRRTFAWKTGGLDSDGLRATVGASSMTLGGLLKHLALVEEDMFTFKLLGKRPASPFDAIDWNADPDWEWRTAADDSPETLYALWEACVQRSRANLAEVLAGRDPGQLAAAGWGEEHPSVRRLLADMIEEYARHVGHADLIRESVDGLVGEDPPR